jgi:hypothetical protein
MTHPREVLGFIDGASEAERREVYCRLVRGALRRSRRNGPETTVSTSPQPTKTGGAIEPAPGDPDVDYRQCAWREFPSEPTLPPPRWTARPTGRRHWRR